MKEIKGWRRLAAAVLGTGLLTVGMMTGCGSQAPTAKESAAAAEPQTLEEKADAIVAKMTTNEKIGQMVMIGVHGTDIDDDSKAMLRQFGHHPSFVMMSMLLPTLSSISEKKLQ